MTTPLLCIFLAFLLTHASKVPVAVAQARQAKAEGKTYDNKHPRAQQAKLTGWGARALAGHKNAFENFAPFAAP